MSTKALREKRGLVTAQSRAIRERILAEDRPMTGEEAAGFEALSADHARLTREIAAVEASYAMEAADALPEGRDLAGNPRPGRHDIDPRAARAAITDEQKVLALAAWVKHPRGKYPSEREEAACRATGIRPDASQVHLRLGGNESYERLKASFRDAGRNPSGVALAEQQYRAAMSNEIPSQGGLLTAPASMGSSLEVNMLAFGGLLQAASTMTTETGEDIVWASVDDTTNRGRRIAVNAAVASTAQPAFTATIWKAHEYTSDAVLIPSRLLEDDLYDFPTEVGSLLGIRLGRVLNTECTTGTGNSMPWGIVARLVAAGSTYAAASQTALFWDDLKGLERSVDLAYRNSPGCAWMMHDLIAYQLTLLKDGVGHYMWQESLLEGQPTRLLNRPVVINLDMDSTIAAGKHTILFGDIPAYKVRRVNGVTLYRLTELYRASNQDGFMAFMRADGNMTVTATPRMKVLQH